MLADAKPEPFLRFISWTINRLRPLLHSLTMHRWISFSDLVATKAKIVDIMRLHMIETGWPVSKLNGELRNKLILDSDFQASCWIGAGP